MSDDRPKKSWRELDAQRDRGGAKPRKSPEDRTQERVEKTAAYSKYKNQLDKLFTPGTELPDSLKAKLGPASPEAQEKKRLTEALRSAPNAESLAAYLGSGLPLPTDDPRLLMSLLDVRDEALVRPVLSALLEIVEGGKKPNRMLLLQRLQAVRTRAEDDETIELADTVRAALG